jgi:membrane fusion protein (multidrug efflux system)
MIHFHRSHVVFNLASFAGFLSLAVIVAACSIKAGELPKAELSASKFEGIPIDVALVNPTERVNKLDVTGTVIANQQVDLVSELTRRVVKVAVKEGSKIHLGDLLFQLDNDDLLAQLERLHQQEKLASLNEQRLKDLILHESVAQQDYDEALTNLKVLQAQVRELQVTISKTRIVAPFDGQVGMINIHPGAIVSPNTVLTNIQDNSSVKIEFSVPEKYSNTIRIGSDHSFTTPSSEDVFKTKVVAKEALISKDTRTLLVRGITPNPQQKLLPGQSARVSLALNSSASSIAITSQALIPSPGGYSVFLVKNRKAENIAIAIGERSAGFVEVTKGLSPGDTLITSNLLRLSPGAPVSVISIK